MKSTPQLDNLVDKLKTQINTSQDDYDRVRSKVSLEDEDDVKHGNIDRLSSQLFSKSSNEIKSIVKVIDNLKGDVDNDTTNAEKQAIRDQYKIISDELLALKGVSAEERELINKYIKAINDSMLVEKKSVEYASEQLGDYIKQNLGALSIVGVLTSNNKLATGMAALAINAGKYVIDRRRAAKIGAAEKRKMGAEGILKEIETIKKNKEAEEAAVIPAKLPKPAKKTEYIDDLEAVGERGPKLIDGIQQEVPTSQEPAGSDLIGELQENLIQTIASIKEELEDLNITTFKILDIVDGSYKEAFNKAEKERMDDSAKVKPFDLKVKEPEQEEGSGKSGIISTIANLLPAGRLLKGAKGVFSGISKAAGLTKASGTLSRIGSKLAPTLAGNVAPAAARAIPAAATNIVPAAGGAAAGAATGGIGRAALGVASRFALPALAGYASLKAGGILGTSINQGITSLLSKNGKERTLGTALYDWTHPDENINGVSNTQQGKTINDDKIKRAAETKKEKSKIPPTVIVTPPSSQQPSKPIKIGSSSAAGAGTSNTDSTPGGTRNVDPAIIRIQDRHAFAAL